MIQGAPVNVLDFGADPTGVANSTAAIQAAIDSISAGVVILPIGTYKTVATINMKNGVSLVGAGSYATVIQNITTAPIITVNTGTDVRSAQLVGMKLLGGGTNTSGVYAVKWGNQDAMVDVWITNCINGLSIVGCYNFYMNLCRLDYNLGHGLVATTDTYSAQINSTIITNNSLDGIQINTPGGGQFLIENCDLEANVNHQINIFAGRGINIINSYFEGIRASASGFYGILVTAADTVQVSGNFFNYTNPVAQIWLQVQSGSSRVFWDKTNSFSTPYNANVTNVVFDSGSGYCQATLPPPGSSKFVNSSNTSRVFYDPYTESGVYVYATSPTTLVNTVFTAVAFAVEQQDLKNEWSTATFTAADYGDIEFIGAVGIAS
jgi:polygalacturonase